MNASRAAPIRHWLKWSCVGLCTALAIVVGTGATYEFWARQRAVRDFPARGRMVDIGGRRIHVDCRGSGTPTVVFESGLDTNGSLSWSAVHDPVAQFTRACAYDRAGIMWSDPSSGPRDAGAVAADLHKALEAARERGPYVMVGHSMGGPYIMTFTRLYGENVVGLVFVDASHPDQAFRMQEAGIEDNGPSLKLRLLADFAWTGLPRILLPSDDDPKDPIMLRKVAVRFRPTSLGPLIKEVEIEGDTLREAGNSRSLDDRPLAVLTAKAPLSRADLDALHISKEQGERVSAIWLALQNDEASWSRQSTHEVITSTHYIQFDRPDAVIAAIHDVVNRTRGDR